MAARQVSKQLHSQHVLQKFQTLLKETSQQGWLYRHARYLVQETEGIRSQYDNCDNVRQALAEAKSVVQRAEHYLSESRPYETEQAIRARKAAVEQRQIALQRALDAAEAEAETKAQDLAIARGRYMHKVNGRFGDKDDFIVDCESDALSTER
eukprot:TRINITY_DN8486_c1_g2_i1.p2 TRINITY_DN8486_c1_g2~~TRINITY_DN8486_c1_g2_i1.p2  ORF type:complete len:168 (+),score=60.13 TRINITY_DN8486_c1_g2_i1:48-506(+)